jgi:hypothetical protein
MATATASPKAPAESAARTENRVSWDTAGAVKRLYGISERRLARAVAAGLVRTCVSRFGRSLYDIDDVDALAGTKYGAP